MPGTSGQVRVQGSEGPAWVWWGSVLGPGSYLWAEPPKSCCFLPHPGQPGSQS